MESQRKGPEKKFPKACKTLCYSLNAKDIHVTEKPVTENFQTLKMEYFWYLDSLYLIFIQVCKKQIPAMYLEMSQFYQGHFES